MIEALIGTILFLLGFILTGAAWIVVCVLVEMAGGRRKRRGRK